MRLPEVADTFTRDCKRIWTTQWTRSDEVANVFARRHERAFVIPCILAVLFIYVLMCARFHYMKHHVNLRGPYARKHYCWKQFPATVLHTKLPVNIVAHER